MNSTYIGSDDARNFSQRVWRKTKVKSSRRRIVIARFVIKKYRLHFGRKTNLPNQGSYIESNVYKCFTLVASLIVEWWITDDLCSYAKKD